MKARGIDELTRGEGVAIKKEEWRESRSPWRVQYVEGG